MECEREVKEFSETAATRVWGVPLVKYPSFEWIFLQWCWTDCHISLCTNVCYVMGRSTPWTGWRLHVLCDGTESRGQKVSSRSLKILSGLKLGGMAAKC